MFNPRHPGGEFFGRRHHRRHAPDGRPSSSSSSSSECELGYDERGCCRQEPDAHCCDREHRKFWKHPHEFPHVGKCKGRHALPFPRTEHWPGPKHCPLLSEKDMKDLPVTVHHGCMPIVVRGVVMFHIVSEEKPSITISNTGAIKVEANGIQLLSASLKEKYPVDKVVASYANKIVTIRIPCDTAFSESSVDIPITIQK
ncbi:C4 group specific protein [Giardia duodenalis assemblage B]|uniref:C4 group specific protein n=1 Tax=Giardia duodenalis assemblage B TaxID=1394984 RepID=A0A132NZJ4_GIAIN|nr:C4 group specific protein [Giardia intestinalis assemblage B]